MDTFKEVPLPTEIYGVWRSNLLTPKVSVSPGNGGRARVSIRAGECQSVPEPLCVNAPVPEITPDKVCAAEPLYLNVPLLIMLAA